MVELDYSTATDEEIQADIIAKAKVEYITTVETTALSVKIAAFNEAKAQAFLDLGTLWQGYEDNDYTWE